MPSEFERHVKDLNHSHHVTRARAAVEIGLLKDKRGLPHLIKILKNEDKWIVKQKAVEALGKIGHSDAIPYLAETLADKTNTGWKIRQLAAEALVKIGGKEATEALIKAHSDPKNSDIQDIIENALEKIERRGNSA